MSRQAKSVERTYRQAFELDDCGNEVKYHMATDVLELLGAIMQSTSINTQLHLLTPSCRRKSARKAVVAVQSR